MTIQTHGLKFWGIGGGLIAAVFAVWMFFFPRLRRLTFCLARRTADEPNLYWRRLCVSDSIFLSPPHSRSMASRPLDFLGNLVFTGTLLLATYWHLESFNWGLCHRVLLDHSLHRGTCYHALSCSRVFRCMELRFRLRAVVSLLCVQMVPRGRNCAASNFRSTPSPQSSFADLRWPWQLTRSDAEIIARVVSRMDRVGGHNGICHGLG